MNPLVLNDTTIARTFGCRSKDEQRQDLHPMGQRFSKRGTISAVEAEKFCRESGENAQVAEKHCPCRQERQDRVFGNSEGRTPMLSPSDLVEMQPGPVSFRCCRWAQDRKRD